MTELERIRKSCGLTQQQLADLSGVHRSTIQRWEIPDGHSGRLVQSLLVTLRLEEARQRAKGPKEAAEKYAAEHPGNDIVQIHAFSSGWEGNSGQ